MNTTKFIQPAKFIIVGIINTIVGCSIMLVCYNILKLNYWVSSAANYFFGSICSFFLNKYFTFNAKKFRKMEIIKFIICILTCYGIGYGLSKSFIRYIFQNSSLSVQDNAAMITGSICFTILNYLGQKNFVFIKDKGKSNDNYQR